MEFKQFFEIFGLFNYVVPVDKEQQMYDFYMLSLLRGRTNSKFSNPIGGGEKPFYEPGNFEPGNLETEEKQADYMLEEIAEKLLPNLKKEFLEVISQAVASEVKDSLYFNDSDILEILVNKERPNSIGEFSDFVNELIVVMDPATIEFDSYGGFGDYRDEPSNRKLNSFKTDISGNRVLKIATKHFTSMDGFMHVAKVLFLKADWNEGYGGPKWAKIVDGYFRLKNATKTSDLIIAIDHVYDLQHNNGSIFTKVKDYGKEIEGIRKLDFSWIKRALDYKRDLRSAKDLLNKVSPSMKKLAARIIHVKKVP